MSLCASCGLMLSGTAGLCPHHHCVYGDDWAIANRIMCDFFHRKKVLTRLGAAERDDEFLGDVNAADEADELRRPRPARSPRRVRSSTVLPIRRTMVRRRRRA